MPDFLDKAKKLAAEHDEQVDSALDKVAGIVDAKTGGKHKAKIDQAVDKLDAFLDDKAEPKAGKTIVDPGLKKKRPAPKG